MTSYNLRQQLMQEYESMRRTALQTAHEIHAFKMALAHSALKKLTAADVAAAYKTGAAQTAKGSEEITANSVVAALLVYDRLAWEPSILEVIQAGYYIYARAYRHMRIDKYMRPST